MITRKYFYLKTLWLVLVCAGGVQTVTAQSRSANRHPNNNKTSSTDQHQDSLNKTDTQNRKQGMWFYSHEALRGEPAYMEFGNYQDGRKSGLWYKVDKFGQLMAIENFSNDVLNGTSHYYQNGRLVCTGNYRGLNPDNKYDSIYVTNPVTYLDTLVIVPSEKGSLKHGTWRYYNPMTGQLEREEEYQVDDLISSKRFTISSTLDSNYIKRREAEMPHNKFPKGTKPSHKPPKYTY